MAQTPTPTQGWDNLREDVGRICVSLNQLSEALAPLLDIQASIAQLATGVADNHTAITQLTAAHVQSSAQIRALLHQQGITLGEIQAAGIAARQLVEINHQIATARTYNVTVSALGSDIMGLPGANGEVPAGFPKYYKEFSDLKDEQIDLLLVAYNLPTAGSIRDRHIRLCRHIGLSPIS